MGETADRNVVILVGSLRSGSVNRQIAETAVRHAPDGVAVTVFDGLGDVPFYNEDLDGADVPAAARALRTSVADADALLLVTPEYNGGLPAVLKNAIDWLSRPYGAGALTGKPVAVIGAAGGRYGGAWAHKDAVKSAGIAGGELRKELTVSLPIPAADGWSPAEDAELVGKVTEVLAGLAAPALVLDPS